ncbi:hypothetical protein SAMN05880590_12719 [Rhizobium sp. RU35A]|uniref:hypothetical protein n=1 Tax=Rhizobium sp. RU35A TaxID=1907414 RepID=UPI000953FA24|nr:hypothetical protein [Rhizobium sp. RU35A]SIR41437.1 hypothetical protein SAMN05880590_12719 [Rhizobium sp. RU35A]
MIDIYNAKALYEAQLHACYAAVREGFPHLAIRDIVEPPHQWFDAALARQVVIHLMVTEFRWPKRRVVEMEDRSREAVNRALRTVDTRLETPRFNTHYRSIAARAHALAFLQTEEERGVA